MKNNISTWGNALLRMQTFSCVSEIASSSKPLKILAESLTLFSSNRYLRDFSSIFSLVVFGQNVFPVVALSATIVVVSITYTFQTIIGHNNCVFLFFPIGSKAAVNSIAFSLTLFIELFCYCLVAQFILIKVQVSSRFCNKSLPIFIQYSASIYFCQSDEVCDSIYLSEWYRLLKHRKSARAFEIFLKHTQIRNELSVFGLIEFSFITLTQVIFGHGSENTC